jgi:malate dehydrogenase (oxaloacetate-decarboxylating)(NADP+)
MYIGKLSLYCAAGGIAPHRVMPVVIDVGTDNEELLNDKFYLGVQKRRLQGRAYYEVIDEFMQAVRYRWPNVLVQFEDFSSDKAQVCTFISKKHCWLVVVLVVFFFLISLTPIPYSIS